MGLSDIPPSNVPRNLGVISDSQLAFKEQVNKLYELAYLDIRWVGSVRQYVSFEATKTLVSSHVLSSLDCFCVFSYWLSSGAPW